MFCAERTAHETYIPAIKEEAGEHPRLSQAHGHQERQKSAQPPAGKAKKAPHRFRFALMAEKMAAKGFSRAARLARRNEISQLLRTGTRDRSRLFDVVYRRNDGAGDRLGVLVSRKIGNAVRRNRVKRICREAFRTAIRAEGAYYDILVLPKKETAQCSLDYARDYWAWRKSLPP